MRVMPLSSEFQTTTTRLSLGNASLRSSSRLPLKSTARLDNPVILAPGRAVFNLNSKSSDYSVCPCQHVRRNLEADLLGGFEVNDEFKLRCLLHWQISRFGAFQDFVHVNSRAPIKVDIVRSVGHEAPSST